MATKSKEYQAAYREANRERIRALQREWRRNNPDVRRRWNEANKERVQGYYKDRKQNHPHKILDAQLKTRFGMSLDEYLIMLDNQDGACAICKQPEKLTDKNGQVRRLAVDHDHTTGEVRALLCAGCNAALGFSMENPSTLRAAADYLEAFERKRLPSGPDTE